MKVHWKNAGLAVILSIVIYNLLKYLINVQDGSPTQLLVGIGSIVVASLAYEDMPKKW